MSESDTTDGELTCMEDGCDEPRHRQAGMISGACSEHHFEIKHGGGDDDGGPDDE